MQRAASSRTGARRAARRAGREQGRAFGLPGRADRVTTGNGVGVAAFGVRIESGGHCKIKIAKLPRSVVAWSVARSARSRCHPPPYPCPASRVAGAMSGAHVPPHVLSAVDARDDVVPRQRIPRLRRFPADPAARLLEANVFAGPLMRPPPSWYSVLGTTSAPARLAADEARSKTRTHDTAASSSRSAVSTAIPPQAAVGPRLDRLLDRGPERVPPENDEIQSARANR